jgi:predicted alpha/beta-hydrolase family hydrolase
LHPANDPLAAVVLAHGASSNCEAALLKNVGQALAEAGVSVLRIDLPFRQQRNGPPRPADAANDQEGIARAAEVLREMTGARVLIGGVSYGGRQASMLAADRPGLTSGLLLLSYPLHPPGKPQQLRTAHLPKLDLPVLFVHGSSDPFGTVEEMRAAVALIPGKTNLVVIPGAGHDLRKASVPSELVSAFRAMFL